MARFTIENVVLEVPDDLLNPKLTHKMESGEYEFAEARAARTRVKPGHCVLELGGGVGYLSAVCAGITDPSKIVTVEANPRLIEVIRQNLDINGASRATLRHAAVVGEGFDAQPILFRVGKAFWGSSIAGIDDRKGDLIEVPTIPLTTLLKQHKPDVVIMDIEGAEQFLFDTPWPKHVAQVVMEIHPSQYSTRVIKKMVDCMSQSGLTYDPRVSRGTLLGFRRV
jgi:FkbM family methyltransferase